MQKFAVIAPEGCGNHLVTDLIGSHPVLKKNPNLMFKKSLPVKRYPALKGPQGKVLPETKGTAQWIDVDDLRKEGVKRVVVVTRDPAAACWSCVRRFKNTKGRDFEAKVLRQIWQHWAALDMMEVMARVFPSIRVCYEDVVADPVSVIKDVATFLGLSLTTWLFDLPRCKKMFNKPKVEKMPEKWKSNPAFAVVWEKYRCSSLF